MPHTGESERTKNCFYYCARSHYQALLLRLFDWFSTKPRTRLGQPLMRHAYNKPQSRPEEEQAEIEQGGSYSCIVLAVP